MSEMTKDHYITAQMMMIAGLIDFTKDNLDDTVFEDEESLESLLDSLSKGCNIASSRMKQLLKEDCDGCG